MQFKIKSFYSLLLSFCVVSLFSMGSSTIPSSRRQKHFFKKFFRQYSNKNINRFFSLKEVSEELSACRKDPNFNSLTSSINNCIKNFLDSNDVDGIIRHSLIQDRDRKNFNRYSTLVVLSGGFYVSARRMVQSDKVFELFNEISKLFVNCAKPKRIFITNSQFEILPNLTGPYFSEQLEELCLYKSNKLTDINGIYNCSALKRVVITYAKNRIKGEKKGSIPSIKLNLDRIPALSNIKYIVLPSVKTPDYNYSCFYPEFRKPSKKSIRFFKERSYLNFVSMPQNIFFNPNNIKGEFSLPGDLDLGLDESFFQNPYPSFVEETGKPEGEFFEVNKPRNIAKVMPNDRSERDIYFKLFYKLYQQQIISRFFSNKTLQDKSRHDPFPNLIKNINWIIKNHFSSKVDNKNLMKSLLIDRTSNLLFERFAKIALFSGCYYISGSFVKNIDPFFDLLDKIHLFLRERDLEVTPNKLMITNSKFEYLSERIVKYFGRKITDLYLVKANRLTNIDKVADMSNLKRIFITFSDRRVQQERDRTISKISLPREILNLPNFEYMVLPIVEQDCVRSFILYKGLKPDLESIVGHQSLENPEFMPIENYFDYLVD